MPFRTLVQDEVYFVGSNYVPKRYSLTYDPNQHENSAKVILAHSQSRALISFKIFDINFEPTQKNPVPGFDIYIEKPASILIRDALDNLKNLLGTTIIYNTDYRRATDPAVSPIGPGQVGFARDPISLGWIKIEKMTENFGVPQFMVTSTRTSPRNNEPRLFIDFEFRPGSRPKSIHFGFRFKVNISEGNGTTNNEIKILVSLEELIQILNCFNYGLGWFAKFGV